MIFTSKKLMSALAVAAASAAAIVGGIHVTSADSNSGPSSSASPYVVPVNNSRVSTKAILTVGDSVNNKPDGTPYRLVGIPDGIGSFDNGDGTFTILLNHELAATQGVVRAHGAAGAFVSKWVIDKTDLRAISGEDLIQQVVSWDRSANNGQGGFTEPRKGVLFQRFCSADLPAPSAFYNRARRLGYDGRIFMNGEESGAEGKAYGHLMNGTSYELPHLGKFSWENSVPNPDTGNKTVVIGLDDSTPGQVYVYVGDKTNRGTPFDKAGLTNGKLYGVRVSGVVDESRDAGIPSGTNFDLHEFGNVANWTGAELQAESETNSVTEFLRPEDGAWDPRNPNDFYFVTTDRFDTFKDPGTPANQVGHSRLWRLHFIDAANPALGGQIDMLLDGTESQQMLDNITITRLGQIYMQEDPGNQPYIAKIHRYSIRSGAFKPIAEHDPFRFTPNAAGFLTQDEESSGILDVSDILGAGYFLLDVQAHRPIPGELVEDGQLLVLHYGN